MSVSTTQWLPVESPQAWIPQSTSLPHNLFSHLDYIPQDYANPEEFWFKLPSNSSASETSLNWNDFVNNLNHSPSSPRAGLPRTTSTSFIDTSIWDPSPFQSTSTSPQLKRNSHHKLDNLKITPPGTEGYSSPISSYPGSPSTPSRAAALLPRNLDIEVELSRQNLYKTELCRSWVESAICKYGNKCQFAHGQHELRPVIRHPKYKTEICKTFHTNGTCPYGKRCRFVHNPAELRTPPLSPTSSSESLDSLPPSLIISPPPAENTTPGMGVAGDMAEEESWRQLQESFKLTHIAPDPVFFPAETPLIPMPLSPGEDEDEIDYFVGATNPSSPSGSSKKGSGLPFFQKLRKQK